MLFLVTLLFFSLGESATFHGGQYQAQAAQDKIGELISAVKQDASSLGWYTFSEVELFTESMNTSFQTVADDMPYQDFGLEERKKLVHTVGVIGSGKIDIHDNPFNYTGIFASGASEVIIRLSAAKEPATQLGDGCLAPGIALKILRSGVPSANVFSMYSLLGQNSFNFFKHDLSNHPPDLGDWAGFFFKLLRGVFSKASEFPTMLGLSDLALYDQNGVAAESPKFPFRIVFHPTTKLHDAYKDDYPGVYFTTQLVQTVQPGTLYHIYVQDNPANETLVQIGNLDLVSSLTTSYFGDRTLFFQHTNLESDLVYVPEWLPLAHKIQQQQQNTQGFNYPDLPF
eukprot:TRINITY_DN839_c0_g1_i8.p1 TRINITY_DN839_c0_g1~~TRINITY_DN839_c0_g1_i8.p1  ORF type:complete len:341 (-),score=42.78 TRINITY_DN839_c0_g1_i8:67-1089(-)